MKSYAIVTVLITVMVVSTVTAQDTIRIQSLRSIDLCSETKRWLVAVSLGTVRFSDSLESFDITIGFNRRAMRPTDVLKEGTLSAQMSNGPTLNTVTPGEMRIFGFNIARSVAGDVPLVAVAGDYIGTCSDDDGLTLPFAPDFNGEFKKRYTVAIVDSVSTFLKRKQDFSVGCEYVSDSVVLSADKEVGYGQLRVRRRNGNNDSSGMLMLTYLNDREKLTIGDITGVNCQIDSVHNTSSGVAVYFTKSRMDSTLPLISVQVKRNGSDVDEILKIEASLLSLDQCDCTIPGLRDTLVVRSQKPIVGVAPSYDDGACTIEVVDDFIVGKCPHHAMKSLEVFDILGKHMKGQFNPEGRANEASFADLPSGLYMVTMRCGSRISMKTIAK